MYYQDARKGSDGAIVQAIPVFDTRLPSGKGYHLYYDTGDRSVFPVDYAVFHNSYQRVRVQEPQGAA